MDKLIIDTVLDDGAIAPRKAHESDAGFDLFTRKGFKLKAHSSYTVDTGVHMMIPDGYTGIILPKSGLYMKHEVKTFGVVDAGYTGAIMVHMENLSDNDYYFIDGDKITQIVVVPIPSASINVTNELKQTERGSSGFGSSGR